MSANAAKCYLLGEFQIEPASRRIYHRDGTPLHLATRPFRVLLHLIAHRDRLVTRTELLDQFWGGREVYDDSLTRCMSSVRKALDDHEDPARYVETRWAEGYRYIGPLEERTASAQPSIATAPPSDSRALAAISGPQAPAGSCSELSEGFTTAPLRRSPVRILGLAATVAMLSLVALLGNSSERIASARSIAVMPLKNMSGEAASDYFSDGLTDSLISALAALESVKVTSHGSVPSLSGQNSTPQDIGRQLHVAYILEGSVRMSQASVRILLRLVETEEGQVIWASGAQQFATTDVFAMQDAVAREAADHVGIYLSGRSNTAVPASDRSTIRNDDDPSYR